jgi:polysaccharide biosynthesis transport protein
VRQDSEAFNLKKTLGILRRRALMIGLCGVVVAAAAFGFSKLETKQYTATASLSFNSSQLSQEIAGLPDISSSSLLSQQASDLELVRLGDMAAKTASVLGHGLTEQAVSESLGITEQGESGVVSVAATTTSPALAAEIANTYAQQFVKEQQLANREYFKSALALIHRQLADLSPQQRVGSDGLELVQRAQTLVLLSELQYDGVQLAQHAVAPSAPSSPKTSRNTLVGVIVGLLIGLGFAFLLETVDRRIKRPEDLEATYRLPLLGVVPESAALSRSARDKTGKRRSLPLAEAETFSLIRAHLRFFNVDRDLRTLVIASAEPGDGKSTIARHLAEAAARLGSRVLLLEADLRDPTLSRQLDIQSGPGLADVLIGAVLIGDATQSVDLEATPGEGASGRKLDVVVAGTVLPPNPGELLESRAMAATLDQVRISYDLVVIDTPPLMVVSDVFPLLPKVDGVVIVGRAGHSRRDAAERLQRIFEGSAALLLGVIANGLKGGGPGSYGSREGGVSPASVIVSNGGGPSARVTKAGI